MPRIRHSTLEKLRAKAEVGELSAKDLARVEDLRHAKKIQAKPETEEERLSREFVAAVKALREQTNLSVTEFAKRCGSSQSFISQVEGGYKSSISLATAVTLATGLGMKVELKLVKP